MRTCPDCGQPVEIGEWPFCPHGYGHATVISDSIPGGMVIENIAKTPMTFYSKSDYARELKSRGLVNKVEHVGTPGSDKSPVTSKWT